MKLFKILCGFLCVLLINPIIVFAEQDTNAMQISWRGDYTNMELIITIKSSVQYTQQITIILYPADIENPQFSDYCRMTEISMHGGEESQVCLKLSDDLNAADGAYKIIVTGNGYLANQAIENVWLINTSSINGILEEFNSATIESVGNLIETVSSALQFEKEEDVQRFLQRQKLFLQMRAKDYDGHFSSLDNIKDAWYATDIIVYAAEDGAQASRLKTMVENNANIFSVDINDADYISYAADIYESILKRMSAKLQTIGEFVSVFNESKAVAVVNHSELGEIEDEIKKYPDVFLISQEYFNKFNLLSETDQQKVLRNLYHQNFLEASQIIDTFCAAVDALSSKMDSKPSGNISTGGGGSTGGSVGSNINLGGVFQENGAETPEQEIEKGFFGDCTTSHWAFPYVQELEKQKIIEGYPDGNFYPENPVTREEFTKMIVMAFGLFLDDANCEFSDITETEWYYPYIASAKNAGIIQGIENNEFGIGHFITREDAAVIAARILENFGYENGMTRKYPFTDSNIISEYAVESVEWLADENIINGFEDKSFKPKDYLSRAEAAKIIYLLRETINSRNGGIKSA